MLKKIRIWRRKKQEKKRERIAALMACILRNKTNEQSWMSRDIEPEYVDAMLLIMKGKWEKALKLVGQIKYKPPEHINCRCVVIPTKDSPPDHQYMKVDLVPDDECPNALVGKFLIRKAHKET